jgi:hypothetical protein
MDQICPAGPATAPRTAIHTQKMPLRTRRSFTRGTPRGLFGSIGLIAIHSSSASSYRMIGSLQFGSLNHGHSGHSVLAWPQQLLRQSGIKGLARAADLVENAPFRTLTILKIYCGFRSLIPSKRRKYPTMMSFQSLD